MIDPRIQSLSRVICEYSLELKPGQLMLIEGPALAEPLMLELVKTALEMGGRGGIVAVSVFAPETTLGVADAMGRRDSAAAEALQDRLTPLARVIVGDLGPAGIKAALDIIGLRGGAPRSPLLPLSGADLDRVRQLLSEAELLVAA